MTAPAATLSVRSSQRAEEYPVFVREGFAFNLRDVLGSSLGTGRVALIADERVAQLYAEPVARGIDTEVDLYTFPPGEQSKSISEWTRLSERMLEDGHDRSSVVVALGGGVTGDLAGFVASTFMRGVPVVQIPTSMLAMVDASVGGKTGVNTRTGKNLLGAFHAPRAVVMDPLLLRTLPRDLMAQGLVEAVKHGVIRSASHFADLVRLAPALLNAEADVLLRVLPASVEIKARVVEEDERETGLRSVLNFGHTLGHALERATNFAVSHGSAVALGMVAEARLGERVGVSEPGTADALVGALERFEMTHEIPSDVDAGQLVSLTRWDKKGADGAARYVLLRRVGEVHPGENWLHRVPEVDVLALLGQG